MIVQYMCLTTTTKQKPTTHAYTYKKDVVKKKNAFPTCRGSAAIKSSAGQNVLSQLPRGSHTESISLNLMYIRVLEDPCFSYLAPKHKPTTSWVHKSKSTAHYGRLKGLAKIVSILGDFLITESRLHLCVI